MAFFVPEYLNIVDESALLQVIQEAQFSNPYVKKIEITIGKLRKKGETTAVNTDPLMLELATYFEKGFGFNSFQLTVSQSRFPNAFTYPISSTIDMWNYKKMVKKTNTGLEFSPAAKVNVAANITSSLLFDHKFSDAEITAILLHEIGHNFSDSINSTLGVFSNIKKILVIPSLINPINIIELTNVGRKSKTKYVNYMRKNHKELVSAFNSLTNFCGVVQYVMINFQRILSGIFPQIAVSNLITQLRNIVANPINLVIGILFGSFGKEDEYTSDSFVAMYGYGSELATGLSKISHKDMIADEIFKSSEFGALWYAIAVELSDYIIGLVSDNHPSDANRILNLLDTLEQEYNSPYINPKFKKETKKEIEEVKRLIQKEQKDKSFSGNYWRMAWNRHIYATREDGPKKKMVNDILTKIEKLDVKD